VDEHASGGGFKRFSELRCGVANGLQNTNRIKKIQEWLPQAMEKRAQSDCSSTTAFADLFKQALRTGQVVILG